MTPRALPHLFLLLTTSVPTRAEAPQVDFSITPRRAPLTEGVRDQHGNKAALVRVC